jgi:hypothetical protein
MTQTAQSLVVFSAALGLLALTETAGDAAFSVEAGLPAKPYSLTRIPERIEVRRAADGTPVVVRVNAPDEQDTAGAYPPFTCAQLEVIDEVEFTSAEASTDCDANSD